MLNVIPTSEQQNVRPQNDHEEDGFIRHGQQYASTNYSTLLLHSKISTSNAAAGDRLKMLHFGGGNVNNNRITII